MQNTQTSGKGPSKQLHQITDTVRDSAERLTSDFGTRARNLASDTTNAISQNYGKTVGVIGLIVAGGVIGYLIGRNRNNEIIPPLHHS